MENTKETISGERLVVLDEVDFTNFFFEFILIEAFEEVATAISEDLWFDNYKASIFVFITFIIYLYTFVRSIFGSRH